jgi:hypothetical protein
LIFWAKIFRTHLNLLNCGLSMASKKIVDPRP